MTEDKARDRAESGDSERERNAVIRPQVPAADRMGFFNGLLRLWPFFVRVTETAWPAGA